jgi:hypothetical protein
MPFCAPNAPLLQQPVRMACADSGFEIEPLPEVVRRRVNSLHTFYFNYDRKPVIHMGQTLPACGVRWTKRQSHSQDDVQNSALDSPSDP